MCLFLLAGSVLSVQSQDPVVRMLYCDNGDCITRVVERDGGWVQHILCGDGSYGEFSGTGSYGGSVCGMTME